MYDINSLFKEMVGDIFENGLEAELDEELGYSKYDYRNKDTSNSRKPYCSYTLSTIFGFVNKSV